MKRFTRFIAALSILVCTVCILTLIAACNPADDGGKKNNASSTITYDAGDESITLPPLTANAGSKIYPPADPERSGYRFIGWTLDGQPFEFDVMPETDITLKAAWNKLYTVSFNAGAGATQIPAGEYAEGEKITMPQDPTRSGYKFCGWTANGKPFTSSVMPAENLTLTAEWKKAYTISFDTGAKDFSVAPIVDEAGAEVFAPAVRRPNYYLKCWKLGNTVYNFTVMPEENITLTAEWVELTNLPSMFINLYDASGKTYPLSSVTRETYVDSKITVTNTDEQFELNGVKSSFKGRGNGSWTEGDKKGYKIKFDKKQSLFGREANKHWVIIACNNFDDVTMSRNYLAYNMANEVFTNIEYATQARWIDVYVNGEYRGVYLLCEHVRVGKGRVDIESEYGVDDTGYLVEYDAYAAGEEGVDYFRVDGLKYAFTVHSPDPEEYATDGMISKAAYMKQVAYIKAQITKVYNAALSKNFTEFSKQADVDSFVDMYILHELFKNVDTGYSSFYLYKKPNDAKIYAGPPWDFDASANIGDRGDRTPQGIYVADSVQWGSAHCASELYISLYQTSGFKNAVRARWKVLSPAIRTFLDERLNDEVYEQYKTAMGKNFVKWKNKYQTVAENDWVRDVKTLKQWLIDRTEWLDKEWK